MEREVGSAEAGRLGVGILGAQVVSGGRVALGVSSFQLHIKNQRRNHVADYCKDGLQKSFSRQQQVVLREKERQRETEKEMHRERRKTDGQRERWKPIDTEGESRRENRRNQLPAPFSCSSQWLQSSHIHYLIF